MMAASITVGVPFLGCRPCQRPCGRASARGALVCKAQAQGKATNAPRNLSQGGLRCPWMLPACHAEARVHVHVHERTLASQAVQCAAVI